VYQIHPDNAGGLYYEKEQKEDGSIEHRHYVGGSILITSVGSAPSTITATKYWHKDHLGSNVAITDAAGVVIERMAYDPFGKRRTTGGAYDQNGTLRGANTDRGFTGHEHLDDLGFIHMNGRIFDPTLGRFLSADPYIQYADNLQSYNRYSYLMNNPLNATDPTGYFKLKKALRMVVAIVVAYYTGYYPFAGGFGVFGATSTGLAGGLAAFGNAVISGAALSGISAGSWKAAGQGALSGALFWGAGSIGEAKSFAEGGWQMIALHAAAGCVSAEASGGDCGRAALSAGFAQFAGGNMPSWGSDGFVAQIKYISLI
jgi:RHS repeat-associated protein